MRTIPLLALTLCGTLLGQTDLPKPGIDDPGVITTRQTITPAGAVTTFRGRVHGLAFMENSGQLHVLTAGNAYIIDVAGNHITASHTLHGKPGMQALIRSRTAGRSLFLTVDSKRGVELNEGSSDAVDTLASGLGHAYAGSLSVAATASGRHIAALCLTRDNAIAVVDLDSHEILGKVDTGMVPFAVALNAKGTVAWVSDWGGRRPKPGEAADPTGLDPDSDRVLVDARGIASSGTVTRIDMESKKAVQTIDVGLHPTALLLDEKRSLLYVANSNSDSVSIIDTNNGRVVKTSILTTKLPEGFGISPTALAASPDGDTVYIACGGLNAVAVADAGTLRVRGFIPTSWYPSTLAASPDGKTLAIGSLYGIGSGYPGDNPRRRFVHSVRGALQLVPIPSAADLANYTTAVMANSHLTELLSERSPVTASAAQPLPVPHRAGDPSTIKYIVYIIKENRTHDQVFGDMPRGNNDPALTQFPRRVSTNHHRLADQFVFYDNFYATGGNSADGHQWATQANETAYGLWPGYVGRSYPYDGSDPLIASSSGFIWDLAAKKHSVAIFGEYAGRNRDVRMKERLNLFERWKNGEDFSKLWNTKAPMRSVNNYLVPNYPSYNTAIPDVIRARLFCQHLDQWVANKKMPNLVIIQLPSDHTAGTTPGLTTPSAMVADNDYALGQMVDALSHTPFWKQMVIFVVEDDAQNGFDHVDGHRTVALTIGPYVKRGAVDSTFYSHPSILKTIELILGLPTMSLYDLIAHDMRASFTATPDFTPYTAVLPEQSLTEVNPPASQLKGQARRDALASAKMRWEVPDAVPSRLLNEIIWRNTMGLDRPLPEHKSTLFAPGDAIIGVDDDD
ncbi:MAG: hypothetical protein IT160_10875 [Bryobacterales bacterium]|nr:hypothetical protein [Bryobacterales bacterium]